ncbi:MAG: sugar ABC transporter ATP-binding protein, partial [Candidatus Sumerlaeia bacterium]|nr:sugar ABC transporter ATP-binding protein [Candidatus Sumerlaeia bacterium]
PRQRVAVGRAIVRQPKVFLFDEPLSNLDAKLRVQMRVEINKLHARLQSTMIYVTHDQVEAMTMGDRIVVMKDGIVQQVADPISLYDNPVNKFVAGFIGTPPMNFIEGELVEENGKLCFVERELKLVLTDAMAARVRESGTEKGPVTLGVRPEDFHAPEEKPADIPAGEVRARVEIIEPMGSELYLYMTTGKNPFVARVGPHIQAEIDSEKPLLVNLDKIHLFDAKTEKAIV